MNVIIKPPHAFCQFHKDIYSKSSLETSLEAYTEYFTWKVITKDNYYFVTLNKKGAAAELETVVYHFLNYIFSAEHQLHKGL